MMACLAWDCFQQEFALASGQLFHIPFVIFIFSDYTERSSRAQLGNCYTVVDSLRSL
jgi:hypothetical protein